MAALVAFSAGVELRRAAHLWEPWTRRPSRRGAAAAARRACPRLRRAPWPPAAVGSEVTGLSLNDFGGGNPSDLGVAKNPRRAFLVRFGPQKG